jgi:hypothetical protein
MGLDIGGNQITQNGSVLTINTGASMALLSAGGVRRPNQPQFIANGSGGAWVYITPDGQWNKMPFAGVSLNIGNCFANSRFTAPVAGRYFFQCSHYLLKDGANDGYYYHPVFAVNGDIAGRTGNTYPKYRIGGHGMPISTYCNGDIRQVYDLVAGDYVEGYLFSTGAGGNRRFPDYSRFTGFLLG